MPFEDPQAIKASKHDWKSDKPGTSREFYCYYMTQRDLREYMMASGFEIVEAGLCPPASHGKILPDVYVGLNKLPRLRLLLIYIFGALFFWKRTGTS